MTLSTEKVKAKNADKGENKDVFAPYRNALTVVEILEKHGIAARENTDIRCLSPDHEDKHPSMHVYPHNVKCYSCDFRKDTIGIVELLQHCNFRTAVSWIAKEAGLPEPNWKRKLKEGSTASQSNGSVEAGTPSRSSDPGRNPTPETRKAGTEERKPSALQGGEGSEPNTNTGTEVPQLKARRVRENIVKPIFHYTDENGAPEYSVIRYEESGRKKNFEIRAYGKEKGKGTMTGVRRVLYNLPAVLASDLVFVVEGEKCVHAMEGIGLVATTCVDGAALPNVNYFCALTTIIFVHRW